MRASVYAQSWRYLKKCVIIIIIIIIIWLKCILKDLWTYVQSFGKICWLVSELRSLRLIGTTQAKACISDLGLIELKAFDFGFRQSYKSKLF